MAWVAKLWYYFPLKDHLGGKLHCVPLLFSCDANDHDMMHQGILSSLEVLFRTVAK